MPEKRRVLILCTGNSARSQMAEALLRSRGAGLFEVDSAGTRPAPEVHPLAVEEMARRGLDISGARPRSVDELDLESYELVITVCDRAQEDCPFIPGARMLHWSFPDPAAATGDLEARRASFRRVADDINRHLDQLTSR